MSASDNRDLDMYPISEAEYAEAERERVVIFPLGAVAGNPDAFEHPISDRARAGIESMSAGIESMSAESERRRQVAELADLEVGDPMVKIYELQKAVRQFLSDTVRLTPDQRAQTGRDFVLAIVGHLGGLGSIHDLWIEIADSPDMADAIEVDTRGSEQKTYDEMYPTGVLHIEVDTAVIP